MRDFLSRHSGSLMTMDKHLKSSLILPFSIDSQAETPGIDGKRILLSANEMYQPANREKFIKEFLKNWLSPKQMEGMGPFFLDMLNTYTVETLLYAQRFGIDKLLLDTGNISQTKQRQRTSLVLVKEEKKPTKMKVEMEEVSDGTLASNTKTLLVSDIKITKPNVNYNDCDGGCD